MFDRKTVAAVLVVALFVAATALSQTLEENWNDFLHYTKIGHLDLARGYAQAVLNSDPDPLALLALSQENPPGYAILLRVSKTTHDVELARLSSKIADIIEQGIFIRRTDPKIIVAEVTRLSGTDRGKRIAVQRLRSSGEYAIPFMLDAMADPVREKELPDIIWALPQIGKDAIRPLAAALQTPNVAIKAEIIRALGDIGYLHSLPFLKYVVETGTSAELRSLAADSIRKIDSLALTLPAAQLFYRLAETYYYHTESLAPAYKADFANIWFWDFADNRLVREKVDKAYFYELMAMRCCEWALKAEPGFGQAIGLWLAAYFKAEAAGVEMPRYFGSAHAEAVVYATTAGPEYLHQALARALRDKNAYVALGAVEALATTAGEKSLLYRLGVVQPLIQAMAFDDKVVSYSAAIAIAAAGPKEKFAESKLVARVLAQAFAETGRHSSESTGLWNEQLADSYAVRAGTVMQKLAETRNPVIDLSVVQSTFINAINDNRPEIQILAGRILAHLGSPDAQRAITAMALDSNNSLDVRIAAFDSLATSAKLNANMLVEATVDDIYALISSRETDPDLRSAAAAAYGALNLPSRKVKDLILDQAKS